MFLIPPEDTMATVEQKNFKRLLLKVRGLNSFWLPRMHLKNVCQEVDCFFSHLKDSDDREGKKKKKSRLPSIFMGGLTLG